MIKDSIKNIKIWEGRVVSAKANKTLVVEVSRVISHPVYKKKYTSSKKFHVHDAVNRFQLGDMVRFKESKPISRTKHFIALAREEEK